MVEIDAITSHPALESLCPPGDFNQNQAYKLLATSDADVYISNLASPPTILTFNHRTSKSKLLIFSTPVDFQVSELLLNEPAKMLAVVGTNSLIVGIIPLFITSNTPTLDMQYVVLM